MMAYMDDHALLEQFANAARILQDEQDLQHTRDRGVRLALDFIHGCDDVGLSVAHRDKRVDTLAATSEKVRWADALQYELDDGPYLESIWQHQRLSSPDIARDDRWPTWGARVAQTGMRSLLAFQLFTHRDGLRALNLYSARTHGFTGEDLEEASALATHVAVALSTALEVHNLHAAVSSRTAIGRAEGILMERFELTPAQAFAVLRRVSQDTNSKLHDVADQLVRTRKTPGTQHK